MTALVHLGLSILDRQLIDSEGELCGKVDDLALTSDAHGVVTVTHLLVGVGAWSPRLPEFIAAVARRLLPTRVCRVPWSAVVNHGAAVTLNAPASTLGLAVDERRYSRLLRKVPGS